MNDVVQFLTDNPVQYLATAGKDGKPKVRPFQFMLEEGGRLYFCTNNQKEVYSELQSQPYVELCASSPGFAWLRLSGRVAFSDNLEVKKRIIEQSPLVKSIYEDAANPVFEVFCLQDAKAVIADFSGQPARRYDL